VIPYKTVFNRRIARGRGMSSNRLVERWAIFRAMCAAAK
jgi:hypothetical protein